MFESIGNINWSQLKQANGNACEVPNAIKDLVSSDAEVREKAYWKLDNHIVLQSDLYEAAYYAIPFLIEIINSKELNGKEQAYELLHEISIGYAPEDTQVTYKEKKEDLTDACHMRVADNASVFLSEVADSSSSYRENALNILLMLDDYCTDISPKLSEILSSEVDVDFKSFLTEAIEELN